MFIRAEFEESDVAQAEASDDPDAWTEAELTKQIKSQTKMIFPFLVELRKELKEKGPLTQEQYATASSRAIRETAEDLIRGYEALILKETNPHSKAFNETVLEMTRANLEHLNLFEDPTATEEQLKLAEETADRLCAILDKLVEEWPDSKSLRKKNSED